MINSSGERIMNQTIKTTLAALAIALFASVSGIAAAQDRPLANLLVGFLRTAMPPA